MKSKYRFFMAMLFVVVIIAMLVTVASMTEREQNHDPQEQEAETIDLNCDSQEQRAATNDFFNAVNADSVTICYHITSKGKKTVEVTKSDEEYTGDVVIPCTVTYGSVEYSVTSIGESAFYYCHGLTSVTFPESLTSIGDHAFHGCHGLMSVTFPVSLISIGSWAFSYCHGLTSVTFPASLTSIGDNAFRHCDNLTCVTFPTSLTYIGGWAFALCPKLQSFRGKNVSKDGRCVVIDGELTCFAPYRLTTYKIPNGVTSVGNGAFYYCHDLTSVTFPESLKSIGVWAFNDCGLKSVTFPASLRSIGDNAFTSSLNLASVTLPESLKSIGAWAFDDCIALKSVRCEGNTPANCGINVFRDVSECTLYVPKGCTRKFSSVDPWGEFGKITEF